MKKQKPELSLYLLTFCIRGWITYLFMTGGTQYVSLPASSNHTKIPGSKELTKNLHTQSQYLNTHGFKNTTRLSNFISTYTFCKCMKFNTFNTILTVQDSGGSHENCTTWIQWFFLIGSKMSFSFELCKKHEQNHHSAIGMVCRPLLCSQIQNTCINPFTEKSELSAI